MPYISVLTAVHACFVPYRHLLICSELSCGASVTQQPVATYTSPALQESEDLVIPPEVCSKGVKIMLETPSKGHYYVIKVCTNFVRVLWSASPM